MDEFLSDPIQVASVYFVSFLLVFLRVGGMFVRAPLFGSELFPARARIGLSFFMALVMFPVVSSRHGLTELVLSPGALAAACIAEFSLGMLIGFCAGILLHGLSLAGHIIDTEMSFALAQVFDPVTQESSSLVSQLLLMGGTVLFFALGGHHAVAHGMSFSFEQIPPLAVNFTDELFRYVVLDMAPQVFVIGVTFAAPVMAAVFLSTVGLAWMARVVPELNIFAFAFPLRIGVGFVFLELSVRYLAPVVDRLVTGTYMHLARLVVAGA
jgi:flagellar biosynthesis protein FliR